MTAINTSDAVSVETLLGRHLTANQRLILLARDHEIDSRRARTRARNDIRALHLMYLEGHDLTPLGKRVAATLKTVEAAEADHG